MSVLQKCAAAARRTMTMMRQPAIESPSDLSFSLPPLTILNRRPLPAPTPSLPILLRPPPPSGSAIVQPSLAQMLYVPSTSLESAAIGPPPPTAADLPMACGRGDKRTKRGKRFKGTNGNSRRKKNKMVRRIKDKLEVPRSTPWPLPFKEQRGSNEYFKGSPDEGIYITLEIISVFVWIFGIFMLFLMDLVWAAIPLLKVNYAALAFPLVLPLTLIL